MRNALTSADSRSESPTGPETGRASVFEPSLWDRVSIGDVGWRVDPGWRDDLLGPEGLRWSEWREQGRLATVKTGPHRAVYRVELAQGAVYIKHFLVPTFAAKVRQWLRQGKGRNEAKRAVELHRIGVPTIVPVALGEQRRFGFLLENYLVTREIPEMGPLDDFVEQRLPALSPGEQARIRRELARTLADLTARLHRARLVHDDFHPGNVLIHPDLDAPGSPRLAMIDLDALRVRRRLRWPDIRDNLAKLDHYFWVRSERGDRYRFLLAYLRARAELQGTDAPSASMPPLEIDPHELCREVERATRFWAERLWRRWGERCKKTNKYFQKIKGGQGWAIVSRMADRAEAEALLRDPDALFRLPAARVLKASRTATVAETPFAAEGKPALVIYKRFEVRGWLEPWLALVRPTRAWRAWLAAQHLVSRGVPTPANLAILTRVNALGWPREQFLMVMKAAPSLDLATCLRREWPKLSEEERWVERRRLASALARLIRTMHERSLSNRDLKAANILLLDDGRLTLIDLVGVQLIHPLPRHRQAQNLARLYLSVATIAGCGRADALRFLRDYLPWGRIPRDEWKRLWREIEDRSRDKVEQNRRRGRRIS